MNYVSSLFLVFLMRTNSDQNKYFCFNSLCQSEVITLVVLQSHIVYSFIYVCVYVWMNICRPIYMFLFIRQELISPFFCHSTWYQLTSPSPSHLIATTSLLSFPSPTHLFNSCFFFAEHCPPVAFVVGNLQHQIVISSLYQLSAMGSSQPSPFIILRRAFFSVLRVMVFESFP